MGKVGKKSLGIIKIYFKEKVRTNNEDLVYLIFGANKFVLD